MIELNGIPKRRPSHFWGSNTRRSGSWFSLGSSNWSAVENPFLRPRQIVACHRKVADLFAGGGEVPARKDRICPGQDSADRTGLGAEKTLGAFRTQFPAIRSSAPSRSRRSLPAGGFSRRCDTSRTRPTRMKCSTRCCRTMRRQACTRCPPFFAKRNPILLLRPRVPNAEITDEITTNQREMDGCVIKRWSSMRGTGDLQCHRASWRLHRTC